MLLAAHVAELLEWPGVIPSLVFFVTASFAKVLSLMYSRLATRAAV